MNEHAVAQVLAVRAPLILRQFRDVVRSSAGQYVSTDDYAIHDATTAPNYGVSGQRKGNRLLLLDGSYRICFIPLEINRN